MSLTVGTGPFGHHPGGAFNFELPRSKGIIYFEDNPRRIRGTFEGETVVDSRRGKVLHEQHLLPVYYFPREEVRTDLLEESERRTHCPYKGDASYWSLRVGERIAEDAAWSYPEPLEGAPPLADYIAFHWNKLDGWIEEDEPAIVHPRDPYHRIDVLDTSRHVVVRIGSEVLAESRRARVLFETGLPPRWYLPPEDVRAEVLVESDTRTGCAYKGYARYRTVQIEDEREEDLVWFYPEPRPEVARIAGYLAFFNERVDLEIDGELQERPETQWSSRRGGAFAR